MTCLYKKDKKIYNIEAMKESFDYKKAQLEDLQQITEIYNEAVLLHLPSFLGRASRWFKSHGDNIHF